MSNERKAWLGRFLLAALILVVANLVPLWLTWKAYGLDGVEQVGWPLPFFERGGFSYYEVFDLAALLFDLTVLVSMSWLFAHATHGGLRATWRRLRTWGTPWEE